MKITHFAALATALITTSLTSGCALFGANSTADPAVTAALAATTREDLNALTSGTPTMPTTGEATYMGFASAFVKDSLADQTGRSLIGDAQLTADFANSTISGTVSNILGRDNVSQTDVLTALASADQDTIETFLDTYDSTTGEIAIENGTIGTSETHRFNADISGTVRHSGTNILFGGDGSGYFDGTDVDAAYFFAESNEGMTVSEDGSTKAGDIGVYTLKE